MNVDRRDFFKILSAGVVTAATGKQALADDAERYKRSPDAVGILYDATVCIGCRACEMGCKAVNNLPPEHSNLDAYNGVSEIWDSADDTSSDSYLKIKLYNNGTGAIRNQAKDGFSFYRHACMHCVDPDCVSVCPATALTKDPVTGIVNWDKDACIGCRYCQVGCPYNCPKFEFDKAIPEIRKCILCEDRVAEGKISGCAEFCPTGATIFGKYDEILAEAKRRLSLNAGDVYEYPAHMVNSGYSTPKKVAKYINYVYGEKEGGGTQYIVLSAVPFEKLGLPKLPYHSAASKSEGLQHTLYKGLIAPAALLVGLAYAAHRSVKNDEETE